MRRRALGLLLICMASLLPRAGSAGVGSGVVVRIHAPESVVVRMPPSSRPKVGDLVIFADGKSRDEVHGYGVIERLEPGDGDAPLAVVAIRLHAQNRLIVAGDRVLALDPSGKDERWEGRSDLILTGDRRYSSRFKRPAYAGAVIGDGHALERGELLIDPLFSLQVGVTGRFTLTTIPLGHAFQLYNLGAKLLLFDNDYFVLTASASGIYLPESTGSYGGAQVGGLISLPTNTKFVSHLEGHVSVFFDRPGEDVALPEMDESDTRENADVALGTSIASRSEYIFDSWDRLYFGPLYDFELEAVGGFLGYLMVFDHLHLGLSVHAADFTNFQLDFEDGYYPWLTLFWRR